MATQHVCLWNKFGYCKYREKCRKHHNNELCVDSSCELSRCDQRHPLICKLFSEQIRCKFNPCKFSHIVKESVLEKVKIDTQKALERVNDIEKILEEKDDLNEKIEIFENKIEILEKEIKNLETGMLEREKALRLAKERDDRNQGEKENI